MPSFEKREESRKRADAMRYSYYKEEKTYEAIAQEYGISRQRVHQIITDANYKYTKNKVPFIKAIQNIVFPAVVDYCIEYRLNISKFIALCGIADRNRQMPMRNYLTGKIKPQYKYAKAVSDATGISIEELMGDEIKCSK